MAQAPGTQAVSVSIGQVPLALHFCQDPLLERAAERYASFRIAEGGFPIYLEPEDLPPIPKGTFEFSLHGATLRLTPEDARIRGARSEFTVDSLLRVMLSVLLPAHRGFLLHAATVERAGKAYVFMGRSGAGKSTVASLSPAGTPLTDEISILRRSESGWQAHGTPFWGEFRAGHRNCHLPLAGVFALSQATENHVEPLAPREALRALLPNVMYFAKSAAEREQLLQVTSEAAETIPFYTLRFRRDASFWEVLPS